MELSIFLAKLFGIYMLVIAAIKITRKDQIVRSIKDCVSSRGLILLSGAMNLFLGLAVAIGHPLWQLNWRGLITLIGYVLIFKGIMRIAFPDEVQERAMKIVNKGYWIMVGILVVIGAFLTYSGFVLR